MRVRTLAALDLAGEPLHEEIPQRLDIGGAVKLVNIDCWPQLCLLAELTRARPLKTCR